MEEGGEWGRVWRRRRWNEPEGQSERNLSIIKGFNTKYKDRVAGGATCGEAMTMATGGK